MTYGEHGVFWQQRKIWGVDAFSGAYHLQVSGFFVFTARRDIREADDTTRAHTLVKGALLIERYSRQSRMITNDKHFNYPVMD
jgi:hypothetical protein